MKKFKIDELTRLAFLYAEQDREGYLACLPANDPHRKTVKELVEQLRNYRLKKWGKTKLERIIEESKPVNIKDIK